MRKELWFLIFLPFLLGGVLPECGKDAGVTVFDARNTNVSSNTVQPGAVQGKIEAKVEKDAINVQPGAIKVKGMEINYSGKEPVIKVLDKYNSPAVEVDKVDVTLFQNQSDKVKTTEKYKSFYPDGTKKSESEKITEPVTVNGKSIGFLEILNLPGWVSTILIVLFGAYYTQGKHDWIGKIIRTIKWIWNKISGYWRNK